MHHVQFCALPSLILRAEQGHLPEACPLTFPAGCWLHFREDPSTWCRCSLGGAGLFWKVHNKASFPASGEAARIRAPSPGSGALGRVSSRPVALALRFCVESARGSARNKGHFLSPLDAKMFIQINVSSSGLVLTRSRGFPSHCADAVGGTALSFSKVCQSTSCPDLGESSPGQKGLMSLPVPQHSHPITVFLTPGECAYLGYIFFQNFLKTSIF